VRIILNTTSEEQTIALAGTWRNILTGITATDSLLVAPRDIAGVVAA
jgi:hypothetical protein